MKPYPTNLKWCRFEGSVSEYPAGTKFRTANGMVCRVSTTRDDFDVLSYVPGLEWPSDRHGGMWKADGSKIFPQNWPPNSHIVEVLQ